MILLLRDVTKRAARGPDRGGALQRLWGAIYGSDYCDDCSGGNVVKAPARHAGGVPVMGGAPPVRRAVGRSRGGVQARLDSARGACCERCAA